MNQPTPRGKVIYSPPGDVMSTSRMGQYMEWLARHRHQEFVAYSDLWRWSVEDLEGFWASIWDYFEVHSSAGYGRVLSSRAMPGASWFDGAALNYAEAALRASGDRVMVISVSQTRPVLELSADQLRHQVARARAGLARLGVRRGDRVAAYSPNIAETLVAFLATASLGAVWSSCAPEFGTRAVLDRFSQIEPKVLVAADGYRYGKKDIDRRDQIAEISQALPSLAATVLIDYLHADPSNDTRAHRSDSHGATHSWAGLLGPEGPSPEQGEAQLEFEQVPFDHPLYILYSSGTTGLPKPIVHGHGGILLEHLKSLALHSDLGPGDRFFWFSTTGWMMWNLLVSGLCVGSAVVLFDGDPAWPDLSALWAMAETTGTTYFGASAPFLMNCRKAGLVPKRDHDLSQVAAVGSTGSPLAPEGFEWAQCAVGENVLVASVSGGTDVCTAFVGANPLLPVRIGEIPGPYLGAKVEAFDSEAKSLVGEQGELVITEPMPSMPVGFWGDSDGSRYRSAYFERFEGVWSHGDWITIHPDGSCVISGRSDATLNRAGVRLGTSEFYSVVESFPAISDSLVVHIEQPGTVAGELLLFVVGAGGIEPDDDLLAQVRTALAGQLSPRHVPDHIYRVAAVPRTLSGKKLEVPVKKILTGMRADAAASLGALADPSALKQFEEIARQRASRP